MKQITGPARLRSGAAHLEAAEGLTLHKRAGAGTVEIKIADAKFIARFLQMRWAARIDRACEREVAGIGDLERMGEIARGKDSEDRPKKFVLHQRMFGIGHFEDRGRYEPA